MVNMEYHSFRTRKEKKRVKIIWNTIALGGKVGCDREALLLCPRRFPLYYVTSAVVLTPWTWIRLVQLWC